MSDQDRHFFDTFMLVLGALAVFTIGIYIIANYTAGKTQHVWAAEEASAQGLIDQRLAPVGKVALAGEESAAPAAPPEPETAAVAAVEIGPDTGKKIYDSACFACHAIGAAGAPKLGDAEDWGPRIAQGMDVMVAHAIEGYQGSKGVMPPKGGRIDLADEEVAAAVEYMAAQGQ